MTSTPSRSAFLLLNVIGGVCVLGSYVLWLGNPTNQPDALWGGVSGRWRDLYTVSMFAAAAGYFAFFPYVVKHAIGHPWLFTVFSLILFPSALWMPLTYEYVDAPSAAMWWATRFVLLTVGGGALALVGIVVRIPASGAARVAAIAGAVAFAFQTAVLDALVWPAFFP